MWHINIYHIPYQSYCIFNVVRLGGPLHGPEWELMSTKDLYKTPSLCPTFTCIAREDGSHICLFYNMQLSSIVFSSPPLIKYMPLPINLKEFEFYIPHIECSWSPKWTSSSALDENNVDTWHRYKFLLLYANFVCTLGKKWWMFKLCSSTLGGECGNRPLCSLVSLLLL